jgi:hypothetical protein
VKESTSTLIPTFCVFFLIEFVNVLHLYKRSGNVSCMDMWRKGGEGIGKVGSVDSYTTILVEFSWRGKDSQIVLSKKKTNSDCDSRL